MNKDDDLHNIKNTISQDRTAGNTVVEELNALKEPEGASRAKKRNSGVLSFLRNIPQYDYDIMHLIKNYQTEESSCYLVTLL